MFDGSLAKHLASSFTEDVADGFKTVLTVDLEYLTKEFPSRMLEHGTVTDEQWAELYDDIARIVKANYVNDMDVAFKDNAIQLSMNEKCRQLNAAVKAIKSLQSENNYLISTLSEQDRLSHNESWEEEEMVIGELLRELEGEAKKDDAA